MAAFTALALGLAGGLLLSKLKKPKADTITAPGPTPSTLATSPTPLPDATLSASTATAQAGVAAQRTRRRALGSPVSKTSPGSLSAAPVLQPRSLIGY